MANPDFGQLATVVIPCLNRRASLEAALRGLARQSIRSRLFILVVDNGSTDGSIETARTHADEVALATEKGSAAARNVGLWKTLTKFMLTLDADCCPASEDWAEHHVRSLQAASDGVLGSAGRLVPSPTADWWANRPEITPHPAFLGDRPIYAVGGNSGYRTDAVKSLGGFPAFGADDAALGKLARERGYRFVWTPEATAFHLNPAGWQGYYWQMVKIGGYVAELEGTDVHWSTCLLSQARSCFTRAIRARDRRELGAAFLRAGGQTYGALNTRRALRRRR